MSDSYVIGGSQGDVTQLKVSNGWNRSPISSQLLLHANHSVMGFQESLELSLKSRPDVFMKSLNPLNDMSLSSVASSCNAFRR